MQQVQGQSNRIIGLVLRILVHSNICVDAYILHVRHKWHFFCQAGYIMYVFLVFFSFTFFDSSESSQQKLFGDLSHFKTIAKLAYQSDEQFDINALTQRGIKGSTKAGWPAAICGIFSELYCGKENISVCGASPFLNSFNTMPV